MACLRESSLEGRRGTLHCDEEGCKFAFVTDPEDSRANGETPQADRVLQFRLRVGDPAHSYGHCRARAKKRLEERIGTILGVDEDESGLTVRMSLDPAGMSLLDGSARHVPEPWEELSEDIVNSIKRQIQDHIIEESNEFFERCFGDKTASQRISEIVREYEARFPAPEKPILESQKQRGMRGAESRGVWIDELEKVHTGLCRIEGCYGQLPECGYRRVERSQAPTDPEE